MSPQKVKRIRKKLGVTQLRLSQILNVTPVTVARWEVGMAKPNQWNEHQLRQLEKEIAA